jgi:RNA polymerase sigma factor FliA
LIDAIDKFEPERGIRFQSYAITRIRGSIIDELRTQDFAPRSLRAKGPAADKAQAAVETRLGRTATATEVAVEMGISAGADRRL